MYKNQNQNINYNNFNINNINIPITYLKFRHTSKYYYSGKYITKI